MQCQISAFFCIFFFQAEDGIRDLTVTGVQTCALPIFLTPGPGSETFFEHAYLASYLGYPLVQGSDLTVRDERVWLKTLDGLRPVDVILQIGRASCRERV